MKKSILYILFLGLHFGAMAQMDSLLAHQSCITAKKVCGAALIKAVFSDIDLCGQLDKTQYFKFTFSDTGTFQLNTYSHIGTYTLYGPLNSFGVATCEQIALGQVNQESDSLAGYIDIPHEEGQYILMVNPVNCIFIEGEYGINISISARDAICDEIFNCKNCIESFSPSPGKYIVSAWVKGEIANRNSSYENPGIAVTFSGVSDSSYFSPSGRIIDDWQRIDGVVTIPINATSIKIGLYCESGACSFDDIRFVPINGSMISYVYDPVNLRLVAELDERNYSTLYEYDEEGKLIRVKKETEKGIMTIQESRNNTSKQ